MTKLPTLCCCIKGTKVMVKEPKCCLRVSSGFGKLPEMDCKRNSPQELASTPYSVIHKQSHMYILHRQSYVYMFIRIIQGIHTIIRTGDAALLLPQTRVITKQTKAVRWKDELNKQGMLTSSHASFQSTLASGRNTLRCSTKLKYHQTKVA